MASYKQVHFRVTDQEYSFLHDYAKATDQSLARLLRRLVHAMIVNSATGLKTSQSPTGQRPLQRGTTDAS